MVVQPKIEEKIRRAFLPSHLEVINESHHHATRPGAESHFKVILVSATFAGRSPVDRHRLVYQALSEELKGTVHALSLQLFSPEEWAKQGRPAESPPCLGGSGK
jgi:BolA protein